METLSGNELIRKKDEAETFIVIIQNEITKESFIYCAGKIFWKTNTSYPLIRTSMHAYQGVRNVSFTENFANY